MQGVRGAARRYTWGGHSISEGPSPFSKRPPRKISSQFSLDLRVNQFLQITVDLIERDAWWYWRQCVCFDQSHRLICNLSYFQKLTLVWGIVWILNLACRGETTYIDSSQRDKHDSVRIFTISLLVQKLKTKFLLTKAFEFWRPLDA